MINSNTTLVKVKYFINFIVPGINLLHSNTTLVKVKCEKSL